MKILILFLSILLLSCSQKEGSPIFHEQRFENFEPNESDDYRNNDLPNYNELSEYEEMILSDKCVFEEVLNPLSAYISNLENIRELKKIELMSRLIRVYNKAILKAYKYDYDLNEILNNYEKVLFHGCDDFLKNCTNLDVFRRSNNVSDILKLLAKREKTDVKKLYNFIIMAHDLKGARYDSEIDKLYLQNIEKLVDFLNAIDNHILRNEMLEKHSNILFHVAQNYGNRASDLHSLISAFNLFDSSFDNTIGSYEPVKNLLIQKMLEKHLYEDRVDLSQNKELNKTLLNNVKIEQNDHSSISSRLMQFKNKHPIMYKELKLEPFIIDEYFTLVDRVYNSVWSLEMASVLWKASEKDSNTLFNVIKNYIMINLAFMIVETNQFFKEKFYDRNAFSSENIFWEALRASNLLSNRWYAMRRNFNVLVDLANITLNETFKKESKIMFDNLGNNIKYMVVYPNMMLLAYKLAEANFDKTFNGFWGSFKVDSKLIFKMLFNEKFKNPWFDFTNDSKPINRYGMIYAFNYALKTETFKTYGIPVSSFLEKVHDEFLNPQVSLINSSYQSFKIRYSNDSTMQRFLNICNAIKTGERYHNQITLDELDKSPLLGYWADSIYSTSLSYESNYDRGSVPNYPKNLYTVVNNEHIEVLRTDLNYDVVMFNSMLEIYRVYLTNNKLLEHEKTSYDKLQSASKNISTLFESYMTEMVSFHEKYGECERLMFKKDLEIQTKLYMAELKFLRKVFQDMTDYREGRIAEPKIYYNKHLLGMVGIMDYFDRDNFYYNRIALLFRMKEHLEEIDPFTIVTLPLDIEKDSNLKKYFVKPDIRTVVYEDKYGGYEKNEYQFIVNAFSNLNPLNRNLSFLNWMSLSCKYIYWFEKLKFITSIYKSGFLYDDLNRTIEKYPSDLMSEIKDMIETVNITPFDEIILDLLGIESKYNIMYNYSTTNDVVYFHPFNDLFTHYKTQELLPFYSSIYLLASSDLLGSSFVRPSEVQYQDPSMKNNDRSSHFVHAKKFFDAKKEIEDFYTHPYVELHGFLNTKFKTMVDWNLFVERSIREKILEEEKKEKTLPAEQRIQLRLRLSDEPLKNSYYNPYSFNSFSAKISDFHKMTENYFADE